MDLNYFTFGNIKSNDYKTYISGDKVYNFPEEEYDMITVPGRSGNLAIRKNRYENIEVTYPAMIFADTDDDFDEHLTALIDGLKAQHGYQRLGTTYRPDEYRLGVFRSNVDVVPDDAGRVGEFDIVFDCKPQRFLTSGETAVTFTANGSITNPTQFEAKPLIKVTGYGTLGVGDRSVIITGTAGQVIYIDCEIMEAWQMSGTAIIPRNDYVQYVGNQFPVLASGVNGISMSGNITKVEVTPRWWRL